MATNIHIMDPELVDTGPTDLSPMSSIKVRVQDCRAVTSRVNLYDLVSVEGRPLPPYAPGAHIRLLVIAKNGRHETRSYSLVDMYDPEKPYRIAVQREEAGQGGSMYLHERIGAGSELEILPPSNHFALAMEAHRHVLIAGGIGITPIFCMAKYLAHAGTNYSLHYTARSAEEMAFRAEVSEQCGQRAQLYFDSGIPQNGIDCQAVLSAYEAGSHVYVCGPAGLIQAVRNVAAEHGWPESVVHFELFNNPLATQDGDQPIELVLQRSGVTLQVSPGTSILDTILAAGIEADYDCKVGECGSCLTTVLEGTPWHRDYYLNAKERAESPSLCTCVSWAKSARLVLDL